MQDVATAIADEYVGTEQVATFRAQCLAAFEYGACVGVIGASDLEPGACVVGDAVAQGDVADAAIGAEAVFAERLGIAGCDHEPAVAILIHTAEAEVVCEALGFSEHLVGRTCGAFGVAVFEEDVLGVVAAVVLDVEAVAERTAEDLAAFERVVLAGDHDAALFLQAGEVGPAFAGAGRRSRKAWSR